MKTKGNKGQLLVQDTVITFTRIAQAEFISLTDIARVKNASEPKDVVKNWLRTRSTIDFLGLWERINNPDFKGVEFDSFKNQAGSNSFTLSASKWIEATGAIGLRSTAGRTGGTYAHKDIAFEFASFDHSFESGKSERRNDSPTNPTKRKIDGPEQHCHSPNAVVAWQP
nr:KilA-N domain-containing protein [uncultured Limnohabitans sp.]